MSATKNILVYGLLGDVEPSYGGAVTLAGADDGILLMEPALFTRTPLQDGSRQANVATTGPFRRVPPTGFEIAGTPKVEMRGGGAAYSASVKPHDIHTLLRISGHSATLDSTAGAEKYTYAPVSTGWTSGAHELYSRGEMWRMIKAYADFNFDIEAGNFGIAEFPMRGVYDTADPIADEAVPSITYNASVSPPKMAGISFSLNPNAAGAVTSLVVRRIGFRKGQAIGARPDGNNSNAHTGFQMGAFDPTLEVVIEQPALATVNFWTNYSLGHANVITFTVGSSDYNKWQFTASQAYQRQDPEQSSDAEGVALLTLRFQLCSSTPILTDHYSLVFPK